MLWSTVVNAMILSLIFYCNAALTWVVVMLRENVNLSYCWPTWTTTTTTSSMSCEFCIVYSRLTKEPSCVVWLVINFGDTISFSNSLFLRVLKEGFCFSGDNLLVGLKDDFCRIRKPFCELDFERFIIYIITAQPNPLIYRRTHFHPA